MNGVSQLFPDSLEEGDEISIDHGETWLSVEALHVGLMIVTVYTNEGTVELLKNDIVWVR